MRSNQPYMQFKIQGITFRISFSFFAVILILLTGSDSKPLIYILLFSVIHESGHLAALKVCKVNVVSFTLNLFGAEIKRNDGASTGYMQDAFIAFCGPVANLLIYITFGLIDLITANAALKEISLINLYIAIFNLLPFSSFDGGIILYALLSRAFGEKAGQRIGTLFSYALCLPFIVLSAAVFIKNHRNIYPAVMSLYLLLTLVFKK